MTEGRPKDFSEFFPGHDRTQSYGTTGPGGRPGQAHDCKKPTIARPGSTWACTWCDRKYTAVDLGIPGIVVIQWKPTDLPSADVWAQVQYLRMELER